MIANLILKALVTSLPLVVILLMMAAAYTDWTKRTISNLISLIIIAAFLFFSMVAELRVPLWQHLSVAVGVLIVLLPLFAIGKMGGGDVKLLAAGALWAGPLGVFNFLFVTAISGGILALIMMSTGPRMVWEWGCARLRLPPVFWGASVQQEGIPYGIPIALSASVMIYATYLK